MLACMIPAEFTRPLFRPPDIAPCYCGSGLQFSVCCGHRGEPRDPPHGVRIIPGFVPADTCRQWVRYLESQPRRPLAVHGVKSSRPSHLSSHRDEGRITDEVNQGEVAEQIRNMVKDAYVGPISQEIDRRIEWFENPQVLRYQTGGLYKPHADSDLFNPQDRTWKKIVDRDVSLLIYLSQEFEGGELNFRQYHYSYKPKTGDLMFFPSHGQYAHQALPVRAGLRYAIVSWAAFRGEPRVLKVRPSNSIDLDQEDGC